MTSRQEVYTEILGPLNGNFNLDQFHRVTVEIARFNFGEIFFASQIARELLIQTVQVQRVINRYIPIDMVRPLKEGPEHSVLHAKYFERVNEGLWTPVQTLITYEASPTSPEVPPEPTDPGHSVPKTT